MTRSCPSRREILRLTAGLTAVCGAAQAFEPPTSTTRSFWLFGLLRPECVLVHPVGNARLHCSDSVRQWIAEGDQPVCIMKDAVRTRVTGPNGVAVVCMLEVPGVIRRNFYGIFEFRGGAEYVEPIVTMDCETATSCVVGAELPISAAHFHALAAQAVVSRSVILGTRSRQHAIADFCDTTHCQFLRSPSQPNSIAARSVQATAGYVLVEEGSIIPARYSAACGGQTQSGMTGGHRYISVRCEICRERRAVRSGHGWGLCQEGAMELARRGVEWRGILAKYYPNATDRKFI